MVADLKKNEEKNKEKKSKVRNALLKGWSSGKGTRL